ncbi:MAG: hypothetical protein Q8Q08_06170 [Candidatus Omnitrophota bacterium]|nr:hypothetical protein [Candidatus Omnitrophota bacterium]MDZ4242042.1 hypothetical protein [Candidatus Omnitrophota bacterium]
MAARKIRQFALETFVSHYQEQRPIDWDAQFVLPGPLEVEIGFGLGEYLIRMAQERPHSRLVGIEQDWTRVKKALNRIFEIRRKDPAADFGRNIRILQVDARVAFERLFVPKSIARIYALFPCPWPKKGHVKHRLFARDFLRLLNSRISDAGRLQIVTDFRPYADWVLDESRETGFEVAAGVTGPRFDTKFERKWREQGQDEFIELDFVKRAHMDVALARDEELSVHFIERFDPDHFAFEDVVGETSVIGKEFLYDKVRGRGVVHLIIAEKSATQHLWVTISKAGAQWCVAKAEGHTVLPTQGVAWALQLVCEAAARSAGQAEKT